jgi:hypothetical protein
MVETAALRRVVVVAAFDVVVLCVIDKIADDGRPCSQDERRVENNKRQHGLVVMQDVAVPFNVVTRSNMVHCHEVFAGCSQNWLERSESCTGLIPIAPRLL